MRMEFVPTNLQFPAGSTRQTHFVTWHLERVKTNIYAWSFSEFIWCVLFYLGRLEPILSIVKEEDIYILDWQFVLRNNLFTIAILQKPENRGCPPRNHVTMRNVCIRLFSIQICFAFHEKRIFKSNTTIKKREKKLCSPLKSVSRPRNACELVSCVFLFAQLS